MPLHVMVAAAGAPFEPAIPLSWWLTLALVLFAIGSIGVFTRRNAIVILMSVEIMLNAANLTFLAFAQVHGDTVGHVVTFFVIAVAAAEAAIGLALILGLFRHRKSVNVDTMKALNN